MAADGDELYTVRNSFYLGSFQVRALPGKDVGGGEAPCCVRASRRRCVRLAAARAAPAAAATAARPRLAPQDAIGEAKSLRLKDGARLERDVLVFRSLLGLRNFAPVLSGIPAPGADKATEPGLRAVRLLA